MRAILTALAFSFSLALAASACGGDDDDDDSPCGNGALELGEECDDGNTDNDDECNNACRFSCGDGVVSPVEACDTGLAAGAAGACPMVAADCDDGEACTTDGVEGTFCQAVCANVVIEDFIDGDDCCPELPDATAYYDFDCPAACGNGLVEMGESCDMAIAAGAVGACPSPGDCGDGVACTDDIFVQTGNPCEVRCEYSPRTALLDGDGCCPAFATGATDTDCPTVANCGNGTVQGGFGLETCDTAIPAGMPGACPTACTSDDACFPQLLLSEGTCRASCHTVEIDQPRNGDMCCPVVHGANNRNDDDCTTSCGTPAEECSFGEPFCDPDCRIVRTAMRITSLAIRDPHIYFQNGMSCGDLTSVANSSTFPDAIIQDVDGDGFADLTILAVFKPRDPAQTAHPFELVFGDCLPSADPAMTTCQADPLTGRIPLTATDMAAGECLGVVPGTLTDAYGTPPTTPQGPCFATDEFTGDLAIGSLTVPLEAGRVAATYTGDPADGLVDGLLRGFVSEAAAEAAIIPDSVILIGGRPLHDILAGGIVPGSCNVGATPIGDDRDVGPDGATLGWWFYVNFTAAVVPFDDKPHASK
jgi:cysteine-rich repeat protein